MHPLALKINTNLSTLDEQTAHNILSKELQTVVFSIDASSKENYEKIRVKGNFDNILKRLEMFSNRPWIELVRDFSVEGSTRFEDGYFDFIYIDAAHDYDSVKDDLEAWWPKLQDGGIFSGHDYFPDTRIWRGKACGVYQAVNEFAEKMGTQVHHVTDVRREGGPGVACSSFFIVK
jgi:hypothetical protein